MGQIAYGQVPQYSQGDTNRVGFFGLRDDGDEAIVRIMHDSPATFEIVAVHPYQVGGKFRNINCIRNPQDDIEKCPLCDEGVPLRYRFYVHLLEYTRDNNGNIVATPKVWERSLQYADTIKDYCNEYAPLSNYIFKIKRVGKKGSMDTKYNIIPANPSVYSPSLYPKDESAFEGYSAIGTAVYNTDYNGMQKLLTPADQEPYAPKEEPATTYAQPAQPAYQQYTSTPEHNPENMTRTTPNHYYEPPVETARPAPSVNNNYSENSTPGEFVRPRRYA